MTAERECKNGKKNDKRDMKRKLSELQSLTEDIAMMKRTVSQLITAKPVNHEEDEKDTPRNDAGNCLVAENGRQETRFDYYALCWRQYLVHFMLGICV